MGTEFFRKKVIETVLVAIDEVRIRVIQFAARSIRTSVGDVYIVIPLISVQRLVGAF
jgi:hypothetical protein